MMLNQRYQDLQTNWSDKLHSMRSLWFLSPNLVAISPDSCVSVPSEADEFWELESEVIDTMPITMRVAARTAKMACEGFTIMQKQLSGG